MIRKLARTLGPAVGIALAAAALSGCSGAVAFDTGEGVPLADLDLTGAAPTGLVLAGPDNAVVTRGDRLAIKVEGDPEAAAALRFTLEDDALGIMRETDLRSEGTATVRVTLPALTQLTLAGSGTVDADRMDGNAEATIAGSGTARVAALTADKLDVTLAGSGTFGAAGTARSLDLTIAGSGSGRMGGLAVETADVTIAGSGDAAFASDGTVDASIMGSGAVTVTGNATCTINAMGSGTLRCNPAPAAATARPASE
ncbi:DUF2807 domain-containing protein [Altererythrobacter aerius]|uniref:DUF2807 domain-containing protein n=1 Tax=Tsuneonella aeria TaxID=1837929 RepID=A0A6I4TD11_9SPHN|nr:head GIN domain-containing protein [Tsuneonella aeria]MXO75449.1 DUF2807 domain-containing protein [Tsuneonella aeria]